MDKIVIIICFVSIISLYFFIRNYRNYKRQFILYKLVSWVVDDNNTERYGCKSLYLISETQENFNIEPRYCIKSDMELDIVKEIIKTLQYKITEDYFKGYLSIIKGKYIFNGKDYFMYLLKSYLEIHQCDNIFLGYDMHTRTIKYTDHGSFGKPLYDALYELSDFGVAFHKLYLVSYIYCKNDTNINTTQPYWTKEESIKGIIDSKTIKISSL